MKKQRLVEKDYTRLSRKKGGEAKKGKRHQKARESQVTVQDQFASMGRTDRERVLRRWSEKSIRKRSGYMYVKRESNQRRKSVNRGKLERDRGITRKKEGEIADQVNRTGMYTRIGVKRTKGSEDVEALEKLFDQTVPPKRRGIGRKEQMNTPRRWLGNFGEIGSRGDGERQGRRGSLKRARRQEGGSKGATLGQKLKEFYSRSRRKRIRMQVSLRPRVRVSREKSRRKSE
jgi:hypothetical protein